MLRIMSLFGSSKPTPKFKICVPLFHHRASDKGLDEGGKIFYPVKVIPAGVNAKNSGHNGTAVSYNYQGYYLRLVMSPDSQKVISLKYDGPPITVPEDDLCPLELIVKESV